MLCVPCLRHCRRCPVTDAVSVCVCVCVSFQVSAKPNLKLLEAAAQWKRAKFMTSAGDGGAGNGGGGNGGASGGGDGGAQGDVAAQ